MVLVSGKDYSLLFEFLYIPVSIYRSFLSLLMARDLHVWCIVLTGQVLRRLDLSNMTHHRPLVRGVNYALISGAQWRKMAIIIYILAFLINGWCIGYMLADDSCMNGTRQGFILACFNKWLVHRLHAS